ncbi:hypothetical protein CHELA41_24415 [Hyphomicrobiales bacterium]|nr:hypothetical protein CHELA41_24415 [Hyphomicrobiales bacterium]
MSAYGGGGGGQVKYGCEDVVFGNSESLKIFDVNHFYRGSPYTAVFQNEMPGPPVRLACVPGLYDDLDLRLPFGYVKPAIEGCREVNLYGTGIYQGKKFLFFWFKNREKETTLDLGGSDGDFTLKVGRFPSALSLANVPPGVRLVFDGTNQPVHVTLKPEEQQRELAIVVSLIRAPIAIDGASDVRLHAEGPSLLRLDGDGIRSLTIEGSRELDLSITDRAMEHLDAIFASRAVGPISVSAEQQRPIGVLGGYAGNSFTLTGPGDVAIATGPASDIIVLGAGNDIVDAGAGNDVIVAGAGRNVITTGAGRDSVVIQKPGDSVLPSQRPYSMTTVFDFDPEAGDCLRLAFPQRGRLVDVDDMLKRVGETGVSVVSLESAAAALRSVMAIDAVTALHWESDTYVIINNTDQTVVRLLGVVELTENNIQF